MGLTETNPTIKPYDENKWAILTDVYTVPLSISITLLETLHQRLYAIMKALNQDQWQRTIFYPQHQKEITLWSLLGLYAWHGKHHLAHITSFKQQNNW